MPSLLPRRNQARGPRVPSRSAGESLSTVNFSGCRRPNRRPSMAFAPKIRFAPGSPLEEDGFELPVPPLRRGAFLNRLLPPSSWQNQSKQRYSTREGPVVRIRLPPAASQSCDDFGGGSNDPLKEPAPFMGWQVRGGTEPRISSGSPRHIAVAGNFAGYSRRH